MKRTNLLKSYVSFLNAVGIKFRVTENWRLNLLDSYGNIDYSMTLYFLEEYNVSILNRETLITRTFETRYLHLLLSVLVHKDIKFHSNDLFATYRKYKSVKGLSKFSLIKSIPLYRFEFKSYSKQGLTPTLPYYSSINYTYSS